MRTVEIYEYSYDATNRKGSCIHRNNIKIQSKSVDADRKAVKKMMQASGDKVKTINFTTNGKIKVVIHPSEKRQASVISGRVFKRPKNRER